MIDGGYSIVFIPYVLFVLALAVLTVALIVLVFAAIRVLRLSAQERELRIERLKYPALFDGDGDDDDAPSSGPSA
jgi:hypothetical protein